MSNTCVLCGAVIPEGRMVCPICERECENIYYKSREEPAMGKKFAALIQRAETDEEDEYEGG